MILALLPVAEENLKSFLQNQLLNKNSHTSEELAMTFVYEHGLLPAFPREFFFVPYYFKGLQE